MKSSWVSDITEFFESLNNGNFKASFKRNRNTNVIIYNQADYDVNNSVDSSQSEHCCSIEKAKYIFENKNVSSYENFNLPKSTVFTKNEHSCDILKDSKDMPPMKTKSEKDSIHSCSKNPGRSVSSRQVTKRSKSDMNRRSILKLSNRSWNYPHNVEIDKENEEVKLRMRNQESYYDGRDKYQSQLPEGPLYQIYENTQTRRAKFAQKSMHKSFDDYDDEIGQRNLFQNSIIYPDIPLPLPDTINKGVHQISVEEDNESMELEPSIENDPYPDNRNFQLFSENSQRLRWAETDEGKKLIKIQKLNADIIKWQEAQFEIITSEASYYRSLEVFVNKIYKSPFMDYNKENCDKSTIENGNVDHCNEITPPVGLSIKPVISPTDKHHLFSNILEIHLVSGELLKALESRWRENPLIADISDILISFCKEKLKPYVTYLRNQRFQTDTYNKLINEPEFLNVIKQFESDPDCGKMNLTSFILLPMQRILRLKLLMTVIKHNTPSNVDTAGCDEAIKALDKLIKECSDEKLLMEQKEEILLIFNRLVIKDKTKVSIGNKPLLQKGMVKICPINHIASKSLGINFLARNNKAQLYLFEDQLIIAKQRRAKFCVSSDNNREVVVDICPRSEVKFFGPSTSNKELNKSNKTNDGGNYSFKLILQRGLKGCGEYSCTVVTEEEINDWKNVFSPEIMFRNGFDFNEAIVIRDYIPSTSKEIGLKTGQILNMVRRISEDRAIASAGRKQGEIPMSYVQFISGGQPNVDLIDEIKSSIKSKNID